MHQVTESVFKRILISWKTRMKIKLTGIHQFYLELRKKCQWVEKTLWKKTEKVFLFLYLYPTYSTKDFRGIIKLREVEKS